jgi:hypothetical protein
MSGQAAASLGGQMKIEELGLFEDDLSSPINLFLGSGFSTLARNKKDQKLVTGGDLKKEILIEFKRNELESLDLQSVYTIIENEDKGRLDDFLTQRFDVGKFDPAYLNLRSLNIRYIYTTNIDNLAYKLFAPVPGEASAVFQDVMMYGQARDYATTIQYVPLHGSIMHNPKRYVFASGQISSAFAADQETWFVFQRELQRRPTLFLGYGMQDAGVLQALHNARLEKSNRWVLLRHANEEAKSLYRALGFHIVEGDISDLLAHLESRAASTGASHSPVKVGAIGRTPGPHEVAQRPVREFFLGAEPTWSDAYSPQIQRRKVNDRVLDQVLQGKNVAAIGLPLSGKSTIIRQVAADLQEKRQCLFFDKISVNGAHELVAEYEKQTTKPIIIIDQFIDSRDGFNVLAAAGGFKFVVAESSMFFDSINVKKLKAPLHIVPCTEIDRADLQRIIGSMPVDIRRADVFIQGAEEDSDYLGLFEGLMNQVFVRDLTPRFRARLSEFEDADQQAYDVYLMACYSHLCRTLVSYDMIYLFVGSKDYAEGYRIVDRIREFVKEIPDADDDQDHFSVRSGALARITLKECSKPSFRRVYERFHSAISSRVIPDYGTFRRYGYDNDFTIKAFPDFRQGQSFYERLFALEDNPYDYQHGAVYMSKLKQHGIAFSWIDTALSKAGRKVFAIRNSHAVILFEANIEIYRLDPHDQTALDGIRQSMSVLQSCVEQDNWRGYHLLRYGDQALKMATIHYSPEVEGWLLTAKDKLGEALKSATKVGSRESYNASKYRRLVRQVEAALHAK